jgi:Glycosyl transferase family 2
VCPCYRDVEAFLALRTRILEVVGKSPEIAASDVEFAVVDDTGGYDDEMEQLKGLPAVRVITPPFNLGHQRALVFGLRLIRPEVLDSDIVVTMDADGEDRP